MLNLKTNIVLLTGALFSSHLLAATPSVTNTLPSESFSGEQVCFDSSLTNAGTPGYAPYYRVITDSDLTLDSVTIFGSALTITNVGSFPSSSPVELEDPNTETDVNGSAGQQFDVVTLPLGSVVANGPDLASTICVTIDTNATIGTPLELSLAPVYLLGDTATGDNGPVVGATVSQTVTPTVHAYTFDYDAPENEGVPGAHFPIEYTHTVDVATSKTINNANVSETVPNDLQATSTLNIVGGASCVANTSPSVSSSGGDLDVSCSSINGAAGSSDVTVTYNAYITDILDGGSCAAVPINSSGTLDADFPISTALPQLTDNVSLNAKHLVIQQSNNASGALLPGATFVVTDSISVSAFVSASSAVVTDSLPDGLSFSTHNSMSVGGSSVAITPAVTVNGDGTTTVEYNITDAAGDLAAASTVSITYTVVVEQTFSQTGNPVVANDSLGMSTSLAYDLNEGASACLEDSSSSVSIQNITLEKTIVGGQTTFLPGETLTFLFTVNVPSGDLNSLSLTDFLPLPVFDSTDINTSADVTITGNDTSGETPSSITTDGPTNSITINWNQIDSSSGVVLEAELDVTVVDTPFADNLFLTNVLQGTTTSTGGSIQSLVAPTQLTVRAPDLGVEISRAGTGRVDAGDVISQTLTITNDGGAPAVDTEIDLPSISGLEAPVLGIVTINGVATTAYSGSFAGGDFRLDDPIPAGAVVIINFTRVVSDDVIPNLEIISSGGVTWQTTGSSPSRYPAVEDEINFRVRLLSVDTVVSSVSPGGSSGNVVVGDIVTYQTTVRIPEAEVPDFDIELTLPAGLQYIVSSAGVDDTGYQGTVDNSPTIGTSGAAATGQTVTAAFDSPSLTVTDPDNNNNNNTFTFSIQALVLDTAQNAASENLQDKEIEVSAGHTGIVGNRRTSDASSTFAEHNLTVTTEAEDASGNTTGFEPGDEITITVTVENDGTAPAYDLDVSSTLNADLFDLTPANVNEDSTATGFTYSYSSPTITYTPNAGLSLATGDSIVFSYTAIIKDDVQAGASFVIDAQASGDSQSGIVSGERSDSDTGETNVSTGNPDIDSLSVTATSEAWSTDPSDDIFAIGEVVTYQMEVIIPEGVTNATAANDLIEVSVPSGYQYIANTATIFATSDNGIASSVLGSNIPTSASLATVTYVGNVIGFDLGDLTNSDDDASSGTDIESITIAFDILVLNTNDNSRTDSKAVSGAVYFENQAAVSQSDTLTANSLIGTPSLALSNTVSPSTVSGGQSIVYTVTASNQAGTNVLRGWEWEITQTFPSELSPTAVNSATLSRGSVDISACASISGQVLTVDSTCLAAAEQYLAPGESIVVTLAADVDPNVTFEQQVTSTANFEMTSLPGTNGTSNSAPGAADSDTGERTGSQATNTSGQSVNNLVVMQSATITTDKPSIALTATNADAQIGETVTLTSAIGIPTGQTDNFVSTLDLPAGLRYEDVLIRITEPASGFSSNLSPDTTPGAGTDPITLDFGTIVNSSSSAVNLVIEIDVTVENIASNQNGVTLAPIVSVNYTGATNPAPSDTLNVNVIEANLDFTQMIIEGATGSDAGDTIRYQTVISNTSASATAYNVDFFDVFPAELLGAPDGTGGGISITDITLVNPSNSALISGTSTVLTVSDFVVATTNLTGDTILNNDPFDLPPASSITVEYELIVSNMAMAGETLNNEAIVTYTSAEGGFGRNGTDANSDDDDNADLDNYREETSSPLTLSNALAVQSMLNAAQTDDDFAPGETVLIDIRLDVIEGEVASVVVTNELPDGLRYESNTFSANGNISFTGSSNGVVDSNNDVTIDFGTLTNNADSDATNDFITLTITATVLDEVNNTVSTTLTNSVSAVGAGVTAGPDTTTLDIIEPDITASIMADQSTVTLGDSVTFTIDLSPDMNGSDAFETKFDIVIPTGLSYVSGSFMGAAVVDDNDTANLVVDAGTIAVVDGVKQLSFQATVNEVVNIGDAFAVSISNGTYSSTPGVNPDEREYTFADSASVVADDASFIAATQTMVLSLDVNGNGLPDPGDRLSKRVEVVNNGGTVSGVTFVEPIPDNTTYVAGTLTSDAGTTNDSGDMSVDIGTMTPGQTVVIEFDIEIDAGVPDGTLIVAQGVVDSDSTIPEPTDADGNDANGDQANTQRVGTISNAEPSLQVTQSVALVTDADANEGISPNDTLAISYVFTNDGSVELTNIIMDDLIPDGLSYVTNSAQIGGTNTASVTAQDIAALIANLAPGESITLNLQVTVDGPLVDNNGGVNDEVFSLQGTVSSDQTGPQLTDANGNPDDGAQASEIQAVSTGTAVSPDLQVTQSWQLVVDNDGDGLVDPGDVVQYMTTIVNNGSGPAEGVTSTQSVPNNTSYVTGSEQVSQGVVFVDSGETLVSTNVGDVAPGQTIISSFNVTIDSVGDGTVIESQATVSSTNAPPVDSDSNADDSDGANPTYIEVTSTANPSFDLNSSLVGSSDGTTTGNEFIQGEDLSLAIDVEMPVGLTNEAALNFDVPAGFTYIAGSARLQRVFDTGLSSSMNPAAINATASSIDVSPSLVVSGSNIRLPLGDVLNSDNDADSASYILLVDLETVGLVPSSATQAFNIASSITYEDGLSQPQVIASDVVEVVLLNRAPAANDDGITVLEDSGINTIAALGNDLELDVGQVITIATVGAPSQGGTATINGTNNGVLYEPTADFFGTETIVYGITDSSGGSALATITVTVSNVNDDPVGTVVTGSTDEDTPVTLNVLGGASDVDGDTVTVTSATASVGTVLVNPDGTLSYTPPADFNGNVTIMYTLDDGNGGVTVVTLILTVNPVNDPPVAPDQMFDINEDESANIDILGTASDTDGDTIIISNATASVGTVTIGPDGSLFFTPPADFNGIATITVFIDDGNGGVTMVTVTINVLPVNDPPVLDDFAISTDEDIPVTFDVIGMITDVDSSDLTITSITSDQGSFVINPDGTVTFTPPEGFSGEIIAEVCVEDDTGLVVCAEITITVILVNTPPIASDLTRTTEEDTSVQVMLAVTDEQDDPLTYSIVTQPEGELVGTLPDLTYIPPEDFTGTVMFTYEANDGLVDSNVATVTIIVTPINDPPIAIDDIVEMTDDMDSITVDVLDNDIDVDGDTLIVTGVRASIGTVEIIDNQIVYTPLEGFVGSVIIDYTIEDEDGESAAARVFITIGQDADSINPVIDVPDDVFIDATALFTKVDLGVATAVDRFGNALPVSQIDGLTFYEPGINTAFYLAEDSEGNRTIASQLVRVAPLISIDKDQSVLEGRSIRVGVYLNGTSPVYPLVVPYTVTGTADSSDHNLISGEVVFESGSEVFIDFESFVDFDDEGIETVVITLSDSVNIGNKFEHVIDIREDNVNPEINLTPRQSGVESNLVAADGGLVTVSSDIIHPDPDNQYTYIWSNTELLLTDVDSEDGTFTFDPSTVPLGSYQINVTVIDEDDPAFTDSSLLFIEITDVLPVLGDGDADLDGIPDNVEGYNDSDGDGVPDFQDAIPECNVLPEESDSLDAYLVEGDPGVCLRIGSFAYRKTSGGAQLIESDIDTDDRIVQAPIATNIGGIFDFIAYGLPREGQSYRIVLPQRRPVPVDAVYRKYTEADGWQFFDETGDNNLWSTAGEPGFCPPPGGAIWEPGLVAGYWCVQVEIVDGGPNDADGAVNSNIIDPGFVGVVFAAPNALPDAVDDADTVDQGQSITVDALVNDTDPDGDTLTITSASAFFGEAMVVDNEIFYTAPDTFFGIDEINYGIADGNGGTDLAVVRITVLANLPPIAVDDNVMMDAGSTTTIDAINNDSDPDGDAIRIIDATVDQGSVTIVNGQIVYTPPTGFVGIATITYTIADEEGLISIAQITVTVNEVLVRIRNESSGGGIGMFLVVLLVFGAMIRRTQRKAMKQGVSYE